VRNCTMAAGREAWPRTRMGQRCPFPTALDRRLLCLTDGIIYAKKQPMLLHSLFRAKPGDEILSIDGRSCWLMSHDEAVAALTYSADDLDMVVRSVGKVPLGPVVQVVADTEMAASTGSNASTAASPWSPRDGQQQQPSRDLTSSGWRGARPEALRPSYSEDNTRAGSLDG